MDTRTGMIHLYEIPRIGKFTEIGHQGLGRKGRKLLFNGCRASVWDDGKFWK